MQVRDLRNSEMKDLERCPQRWHWAWNDRLKPTRMNTKLWMGIGVHEALAAWYLKGFRRGPHPAETWKKFCDKAADDASRSSAQPAWEEEEIEWVDAVELGIYVLEQYVNTYGKDPQYEFLATEQVFRMSILTPKEHRVRIGRREIVRLVGTADGVYRDLETGLIWLIEHKTSAVGGVSRWLKMLPIDKQTNTYYMAMTYRLRKLGLIGPDENIAGVMFNFLEKYKPKPDDRPVDPQGMRTNKPQKVHYLAQLPGVDEKMTLKAMEEIANDLNIQVFGEPSANQPKPPESYFTRESAFRGRGDLRFTYGEIANTGVMRENYLLGITPLTKNPTMDCSWDCSFHRLCQLHSAGEDWEEYRDLAFKHDDPYADHNNRKKA